MKFENIIIDGVSIINSVINKKEGFKENQPDPLLKQFVGWIKDCKEIHDPKNMIVLLPAEGNLSLDKIHVITKILKDMGVYSKSINDLSVGNSISLSLKELKGNTLVSSESILMTQFISDDIFYKKFNNESVLGIKDILDLVGLKQSQIPDLVAMIGDQNLSLKTFIGPSFAVSWLKDFGNIQGILDNVSSIPRAMRSLLVANKGNINMQLKDADFSNPGLNVENIDLKSIKVHEQNSQLLYNGLIDAKLFDFLPDELREKYIPKTNLGSENTYTNHVIDEVERSRMLSVIEKTGTASVYMSGTDVSVTAKPGESYFFSISDDNGKKALTHLFEDKNIKIVTHDAKNLYKWAFKNNVELNSLVSDSSILSYAISTANSEAELNNLFKDILGTEVTVNKSENDKEDKIRIFGEKSNHQLALNRALYKKASVDKNARKVFEEIDLPLIKVISKMEYKGVLIDVPLLEKTGQEILDRISFIEKKVDASGTKNYDLSKSADVAKLIYEDLGLPVLKRTSSGGKGTSEEALSGLKEMSEIPSLIIEHRSLKKLYSSYVVSLLSKVDKETNRVHCSFFQNVTATGRLSARDPNLQSIPIRSEYGKKIRQAFIDEKNHYVMAADYSQVELRILAHLSGDDKLIDAFRNGIDIHRATASEIFGIPLNQVTGEQRRCAKSINFGIVYGMSAFGLSKKIERSVEESELFIKKYFDKYPKVEKYLESTKKFARENGYVLTAMGRKIPCENINSKNHKERSTAERAAINAPMQGTSSDIIKMAMNSLSLISENKEFNFDMIMQVHDELVFVAHKSEIKKLHYIVKNEMEHAFKLDVPLTVDIGIGQNWENSHSLDDNAAISHNEFEL